MQRRTRNTERGAMVLFMGIAVLLLAFAGFVIDLGLFATAKTENQDSANAAVLAAMRGLSSSFASNNTGTDAEKIAAALEVARNAAAQSLDDNSEVQLSGKFSDHSTSSILIKATNVTPTEVGDGYLIPGIWLTTTPTGGCSAIPGGYCSCDGTNSIKAPCFQPIANTERPTALRIELTTPEASKIRSFFSSIVGQKSFSMISNATAMMMPRRGVFMFDVSTSVTDDTHPEAGTDGPRYAFFADPRQSPACTGAGSPDGASTATWDPYFARFGADDASHKGSQLWRYHRLSNARKAQYKCVSAPNTADEASVNGTEPGYESNWANQTYLVDTAVEPEPLNSILRGIHIALTKFLERSVTGDKVAVIAFDDAMLSSRATMATVAGKSRIAMIAPRLTNGSVNPEFQAILDATDVDHLTLEQRLAKKFFLPRFFGSQYWSDSDTDHTAVISANRNSAYTNLPSAILTAEEVLKYGSELGERPDTTPEDPAFRTADNFLMVFTDAKNNCSWYTELPDPSPYCNNLDKEVYSAGQPYSENDATYWLKTSYWTWAWIVANRFTDEGITVHFSLTGEGSHPSNTMRKDPQLNKCITESRQHQLYQQWYDQISEARPDISWAWYSFYTQDWGNNWDVFGDDFAYMNVIQQVISATGGHWMPLRQPCPALFHETVAQCKAGSVMAAIDSVCASIPKKDSWDGTDFSAIPEVILKTASGSNFTYVRDGWYQSPGNLICDPYCRTKAEQTADYVDVLFRENPYVLVQ